MTLAKLESRNRRMLSKSSKGIIAIIVVVVLMMTLGGKVVAQVQRDYITNTWREEVFTNLDENIYDDYYEGEQGPAVWAGLGNIGWPVQQYMYQWPQAWPVSNIMHEMAEGDIFRFDYDSQMANASFFTCYTLNITLGEVRDMVDPIMTVTTQEDFATGDQGMYDWIDRLYVYWIKPVPTNWQLYTRYFGSTEVASYSEHSDGNGDRYMIFALDYWETDEQDGNKVLKTSTFSPHDMSTQGYLGYDNWNQTNMFDSVPPYDDGAGDQVWWSPTCNIDEAASMVGDDALLRVVIEKTMEYGDNNGDLVIRDYRLHIVKMGLTITDLKSNVTELITRAEAGEFNGGFTGGVMIFGSLYIAYNTPRGQDVGYAFSNNPNKPISMAQRRQQEERARQIIYEEIEKGGYI